MAKGKRNNKIKKRAARLESESQNAPLLPRRGVDLAKRDVLNGALLDAALHSWPDQVKLPEANGRLLVAMLYYYLDTDEPQPVWVEWKAKPGSAEATPIDPRDSQLGSDSVPYSPTVLLTLKRTRLTRQMTACWNILSNSMWGDNEVVDGFWKQMFGIDDQWAFSIREQFACLLGQGEVVQAFDVAGKICQAILTASGVDDDPNDQVNFWTRDDDGKWKTPAPNIPVNGTDFYIVVDERAKEATPKTMLEQYATAQELIGEMDKLKVEVEEAEEFQGRYWASKPPVIGPHGTMGPSPIDFYAEEDTELVISWGEPSGSNAHNATESENIPEQTQHISTISDLPRNSNTSEQPADSAAAEQLSEEATLKQPASSATAEQPANSAAAEQPSDAATSEQPANSATAEQPSNSAISEQPSNSNDSEQPSNSATAEQPPNANAAEQPPNANTAEQMPNANTAEQPPASNPPEMNEIPFIIMFPMPTGSVKRHPSEVSALPKFFKDAFGIGEPAEEESAASANNQSGKKKEKHPASSKVSSPTPTPPVSPAATDPPTASRMSVFVIQKSNTKSQKDPLTEEDVHPVKAQIDDRSNITFKTSEGTRWRLKGLEGDKFEDAKVELRDGRAYAVTGNSIVGAEEAYELGEVEPLAPNIGDQSNQAEPGPAEAADDPYHLPPGAGPSHPKRIHNRERVAHDEWEFVTAFGVDDLRKQIRHWKAWYGEERFCRGVVFWALHENWKLELVHPEMGRLENNRSALEKHRVLQSAAEANLTRRKTIGCIRSLQDSCDAVLVRTLAWDSPGDVANKTIHDDFSDSTKGQLSNDIPGDSPDHLSGKASSGATSQPHKEIMGDDALITQDLTFGVLKSDLYDQVREFLLDPSSLSRDDNDVDGVGSVNGTTPTQQIHRMNSDRIRDACDLKLAEFAVQQGVVIPETSPETLHLLIRELRPRLEDCEAEYGDVPARACVYTAVMGSRLLQFFVIQRNRSRFWLLDLHFKSTGEMTTMAEILRLEVLHGPSDFMLMTHEDIQTCLGLVYAFREKSRALGGDAK